METSFTARISSGKTMLKNYEKRKGNANRSSGQLNGFLFAFGEVLFLKAIQDDVEKISQNAAQQQGKKC